MQINPVEALTRCIEHREIFHDEMLGLMRSIMKGEVSPQITAALLTALRVKKETIGAIVTLSPDQVARCIDQTGVGFMFAPNHHTAMKNVASVRKELGIRTIFNILGPLTNPAGAPNQLM